MSLTDNVKEWAYQAGFDAVGITTVDPLPEAEQAALERIRSGMMADMAWFSEDRARLACRPAELVPGARSVIVLAKGYLPPGSHCEVPSEEPLGRIARYAWGEDYHEILPRMIDDLLESVARSRGARPTTKVFVDSGRLAEKAVAARSGIGWFGKNGLLLTADHGSWVFLGEIVSDLSLKSDEPLQRSCGDCRLCVERCPTGALVSPYVMDAGRCISYLTIEHRGAIPRDLRPLLGNWIFGCDVCQEVCPHNRLIRPTEDPVFAPRKGLGPFPVLHSLLGLDAEEFKRLFSHSPLLRARRKGLLRNAAVALGNARDPASLPVLAAALQDQEALVRSHAAWALGQIGGRRARVALEDSLVRETDEDVRGEIQLALAR